MRHEKFFFSCIMRRRLLLLHGNMSRMNNEPGCGFPKANMKDFWLISNDIR